MTLEPSEPKPPWTGQGQLDGSLATGSPLPIGLCVNTAGGLLSGTLKLDGASKDTPVQLKGIVLSGRVGARRDDSTRGQT